MLKKLVTLYLFAIVPKAVCCGTLFTGYLCGGTYVCVMDCRFGYIAFDTNLLSRWLLPINQAINQSINQSGKQAIKQAVKQESKYSINQVGNQTDNQSINQPIKQTLKQSTKQTSKQLSNQATNKSTNQSTNQSFNRTELHRICQPHSHRIHVKR